MSKAEKMFNELGYIKDVSYYGKTGDVIRFTHRTKPKTILYYIEQKQSVFDARSVDLEQFKPFVLTIKESKAHNEQMKELGWLE